ncbi:MAG: tRNA-dihydrouridine synthase, partial [Betaproteobacteria bacterium]|nr:tRNA-dihydrouridine synthase [Betaproteobacteria bacterium]
VAEVRALIGEHLADHYAFYGEALGVRIARKHLHWYTRELLGSEGFRRQVNAAESVAEQSAAVDRFFDAAESADHRLQYRPSQVSWEEEALAA